MAEVFQLPLMIGVTSMDIATEAEFDSTMDALFDILKENYKGKILTIVKSLDDVVRLSSLFLKECATPVFPISNVTMEGLDLFVQFLNKLPAASQNHLS